MGAIPLLHVGWDFAPSDGSPAPEEEEEEGRGQSRGPKGGSLVTEITFLANTVLFCTLPLICGELPGRLLRVLGSRCSHHTGTI
jgi:hypothetical protein